MVPPSPHLGVHLWSKQGPFDTTIPNTNIPLPFVNDYLQDELETSTLDSVYHHLWMAGMRREYIKPLHHQRVLHRDIVVSERMHLISRNNIIYIKPIPACLLHSDFFLMYVHGQRDWEDLALGFLSSYLSLITHESDLHIANELHLFPEVVEWRDWLTFSQHLTAKVDVLRVFNNRYDFAELRLDRLNLIVMLSQARLRGYMRLETTYTEYFHSFWSVITLLVFGFSSIALSAFQVVMANPVQPPAVASVGLWSAITILCLLGAVLFSPFLWFLVIFIDNFLFAIFSRK
ncbi:hypothetical protein JOM56_013638 [Amanita muscaria]